MLKIYPTLLLCLAALDYRLFVNANDVECSLNTDCRRLWQCPFFENNWKDVQNKPYCKKSGTFVCCPLPPEKYVQPKDENLRAVKECKSYQRFRSKCEKPLIVGGNKTEPKEFPFMALLSYYNGIEHKWECGGSLISSKYVLTAAHCFYLNTNNPNNVRLGELDYNSDTDDAKPMNFEIKDKNIRIHPDYDYHKHFNDIALVQLNETVTFNDYIIPACLPLADGRQFGEFFAAGWGAIQNTASITSSHLLYVRLDSFNDTFCLEKIGNRGTVINTTIQMCAGSFRHIRDTCTGDSGGPLFVNHPDYNCMFLISGITSFAEGGCPNKHYPSFYTRVSSYVNWIEGIVWP